MTEDRRNLQIKPSHGFSIVEVNHWQDSVHTYFEFSDVLLLQKLDIFLFTTKSKKRGKEIRDSF
jgi:hypothetical protein